MTPMWIRYAVFAASVLAGMATAQGTQGFLTFMFGMCAGVWSAVILSGWNRKRDGRSQ
jgi:hypothetical protein